MIKRAIKAVGKFLDGLALIMQLFIRYTVIGILYLVGLYYTFALLINLTEDTTAITNATFAIFATLAGLSFGWSRATESTSDLKTRVAHAGERFLHAAVCVLTASVLKYAALASALDATAHPSTALKAVVGWVAGIAVSGLFLAALAFAHRGIVVLNRLLWERAHQFREYDSLA